MKNDDDKSDEYFNVEDLKRYMALSAEQKLIYLEEANKFFHEVMSPESKKAWKELKESGW
jgi:hypothetical protein